jgi:hypothetical protein
VRACTEKTGTNRYDDGSPEEQTLHGGSLVWSTPGKERHRVAFTEPRRRRHQNHVDYEIERDRKNPYSEQKAAHERMTTRSSEIPTPAGLDAVTSIGGRPLTEKTYPNPYSVAQNETEETNR